MRIIHYKTMIDQDSRLNILVKERAVNYPANSISSPGIIYEMMSDIYNMQILAEEYCYLIALDTKNKVLGVSELSHGIVNASMVMPREIFIRALLCGAVQVILVHNHPSGDPTPSLEDLKATKRVKEAGELMGISLIDHIIIGNEKYVSLKEQGIF